jgi:hypothetical protein
MEVKDRETALKLIGSNHLMHSKCNFGEGRDKERKNSAPGLAPLANPIQGYGGYGLSKCFDSGEVVFLACSIAFTETKLQIGFTRTSLN